MISQVSSERPHEQLRGLLALQAMWLVSPAALELMADGKRWANAMGTICTLCRSSNMKVQQAAAAVLSLVAASDGGRSMIGPAEMCTLEVFLDGWSLQTKVSLVSVLSRFVFAAGALSRSLPRSPSSAIARAHAPTHTHTQVHAALGLAKLQDPKDFDAESPNGVMLLNAIFAALNPPKGGFVF